MGWFNVYGLIILVVMMIPNIIEARIHPDHFENHFNNKTLEVFEQIGRFGSFLLMIINIPGLYAGFWFELGKTVYIVVNSILLLIYLAGWIVMKDKDPVVRAYLLSVTPSLIFIFSGVMILYYPLIIVSLLFAMCHIFISVKNAKLSCSTEKQV